MLESNSLNTLNDKFLSKEESILNISSKPKSIKAIEDQQLVARALEYNDQAAYAKLLDRYKNPINFMILQMVKDKDDAEDITMEAFGKAFNKIHRYDPKYAFSTWVFRIATNTCIDFMRKKKIPQEPLSKFNNEGEGYKLDPKSDRPDPEERYIIEQRKALAKDIVKRLPDQYRILVELRFFKELSYPEIAKMLEIPEGTIKARIFRSKALLLNILKDQDSNY